MVWQQYHFSSCKDFMFHWREFGAATVPTDFMVFFLFSITGSFSFFFFFFLLLIRTALLLQHLLLSLLVRPGEDSAQLCALFQDQ